MTDNNKNAIVKSAEKRASVAGQPVPAPRIGSFLLESITTGMYGERRNAIREYVQNSFDSIQSAIATELLSREDGKITITVDRAANSLRVHDNGVGIGHRVAVNIMTAVGASRKSRHKQAGFRGIGRLAGIAFSSRLQLVAKAKNDKVETIVDFDCDSLRKGMLDGKKTASQLMEDCVTWQQKLSKNAASHYFEVILSGLKNAPVEATDVDQLEAFLSQVAPVDYHPDFKQLSERFVSEAARARTPAETKKTNNAEVEDDNFVERDEATMLERIPVERVALEIINAESGVSKPVFKPYRPKMTVSKKVVPLERVVFHHGTTTGDWWGWVGEKAKPGGYDSQDVAGIRFRVRNIQLDGNDMIRDVPVENVQRPVFARWSDWFVGEIYVDPRIVVPNARRDNFEETPRWLAIRAEISNLCTELTNQARDVSSAHQASVEKVTAKVAKLRQTYLSVSRAKVFDAVKARKLIVDTDGVEKAIETAMDGALAGEQVKLKSLGKEVTQIRVSLLERPDTHEFKQFRQALLDEFLEKTVAVLNDYLDFDVIDDVKAELTKVLR